MPRCAPRTRSTTTPPSSPRRSMEPTTSTKSTSAAPKPRSNSTTSSGCNEGAGPPLPREAASGACYRLLVVKLAQLLADLRSVLGIRLQFQILTESFFGGFGVFLLLFHLAQPQPGFGVTVVPLGGLAEALRRGPIAALLEIEVADLKLFGRL